MNETTKTVRLAAAEVQVGDTIVIGEQPKRVISATCLSNGRRLRLHTGELLVLHARSALTITRRTGTSR